MDTDLGLVCGRCGLGIGDCICADADTRMREASDSKHVIFKWCRTCDNHYARCKCEVPNFGVRTGGVVYGPEYLDKMRSLDGHRIQIDPKVR